MSPSDRDHMVTNIVAHLGGVASHAIVAKAIAYWRSVDPDLGDRVSVGLGLEPVQPIPATVA